MRQTSFTTIHYQFARQTTFKQSLKKCGSLFLVYTCLSNIKSTIIKCISRNHTAGYTQLMGVAVSVKSAYIIYLDFFNVHRRRNGQHKYKHNHTKSTYICTNRQRRVLQNMIIIISIIIITIWATHNATLRCGQRKMHFLIEML